MKRGRRHTWANVPGGRVRWVVRRDARIHSTGERGDSNGKESEGRKEEGGQEEIALHFNPQFPTPNFQAWELGVGPASAYSGFTPSRIRTFRITSHCTSRSMTSMPFTTRPKTVYRASRCGCGEWVMKNWLPPVSSQSSAIPTVPRRYGSSFSSSRIV